MLTFFLFLMSEGLSSCLILLQFSSNGFPFIFLDCKWPNIICCSFSIGMPMFWLFLQVVCYFIKHIIVMFLLNTIGCPTRMCVLYHITFCYIYWSFTFISHLQKVIILYDLSYVLSLKFILSWHSLYVVIFKHAHSFSDLLSCFVFVISLWVLSIMIT